MKKFEKIGVIKGQDSITQIYKRDQFVSTVIVYGPDMHTIAVRIDRLMQSLNRKDD